MYGVAFTQQIDNDSFGVLLFKVKAKAEMAYRVMCGMDELSSLDPNLTTVLDSSDFKEIPEFDDVYETMSIEVEGKSWYTRIINISEKAIIPDVE
jgi:hypothetical protein